MDSFRGSVVRTLFQNGSGLGRLTVDPDQIQLQWFPARQLVLSRTEVKCIGRRRLRIPPFAWTTYVEFFRQDGQRVSHRFAPFRPKRVFEALEKHGWTLSEI